MLDGEKQAASEASAQKDVERTDLLIMLKDAIKDYRERNYMVLLMGDLNCALTEYGRRGGMCRLREHVHGCSEASGVVDLVEYGILVGILVHVPWLRSLNAEAFPEGVGRGTDTV